MAPKEAKKILVVDDDPGVLRFVQKALAREGFFCLTANSAEGAMRLIEKHRVRLLVLDLQLQETHATNLIQKLEHNGHAIPFVIITGQGDERVAVEMMKRGALDYVVKDTNFLEFLPTVIGHSFKQIERENRVFQAEQAVQESERRFRETLDGMIEGCQTLGFDWRYLYVNEAAARHGRRTVKELLGHTVMEVYPGIESTPLFSRLDECMKRRTPGNLENEFHFGDEESAWFQLSVQPVPEGLFILSLDITKRKEAERCRQLQYDIAVILAENDSLEKSIMRVLDLICRELGWKTGEYWTVDQASNLLRIVVSSTQGEWTPLWEEFTRTRTLQFGKGIPGDVFLGRKPAYIQNLRKVPNFKRRILAEKLGMTNSFAFPLVARQEVLGVIVLFGNVSQPPDEELWACFASIGAELSQFIERKKLEREVLEISHKEQNRLGRDLHDGLGQQLTALQFFTVKLAAEAEEKCPHLGKEVRKMGDYLRDAIKQTRAMANGLSPVTLHEGGLVTALSKLAEGVGAIADVDCKLVCRYTDEIGTEDAIQLYRIAQESTNNALKHGRAKRIRISLTRRKNGQLQLAIGDNGCGFSPSEFQGDGMGLRVMKYRAALIGADLKLASRPGKGTRVTCSLRKYI